MLRGRLRPSGSFVQKGEGLVDSSSPSEHSSGGASVSPPGRGGDVGGLHEGMLSSVDDEGTRLEQGVKHLKEMIQQSHKAIQKEQEKIKKAEKLIKVKKKAKTKSTSSHGHSTSSHEPQSPRETSRETVQPESPVFDCGDSVESEEPRRKPSASPPVSSHGRL